MITGKWYKRVNAVLTALVMVLFLLPQGAASVRAAGESAVSLSGVTLLINGNPVTNSTKINNGDEVFFSFDWSVNKSADEVLVNPLTADIDFTGIYLLSDQGDLQQGSQARGTYEITSKTDSSGKVTGNVIKFFVEESQLQQSNIKGKAVFKGNIAYTADDIGNDGRFDIKATVSGTPVLTLRPEAVAKSNAWVSKSADGGVYKGNDGKYYQKYTVTVSANANSTANYTINSFSDEPITPGLTSLSGEISVSKSGTVDNLPSPCTDFGQMRGVVLHPGSSVTLKYTMQVDRGIIKDRYNTWQYGNRVRVNDMESTASPFVPEILVPNVSKSGWLDQNNKRIVWTVEIGYTGFTGNKSSDRAMVTMSDSLTVSPDIGDTVTDLTADEFWSKANAEEVTVWGVNGNEKRWKYSYTYETKYKESSISTDRVFTNKLSATVDGFDYERTATVTIPGGNPLNKEFTGVDNDGNFNWTITFTAPASGEIKNLKITDTLGADNGLSHEIIGSITTTKGTVTGNVINVGDLSRGETVTITLKTKPADSSKTGRYFNNAKADYIHTIDGTPYDIEKTDGAQYETQSIVSKTALGNVSDLIDGRPATQNDICWAVTVDLNKLKNTVPKAGDTVTLTDVPSAVNGQSISTKGIYKIQVGGNPWWTPDGSIVTDRYLNNGVSLSGNTITVTLDQNMINNKQIIIYYYQQVDDPTQLEGSYDIRNSVSAVYNGKDAGSTSASQWKGFTKEDILTKSSSNEGNIVHYVIEVNKPGMKLAGTENNIFLEDEMGSRLVFLENTLVVTDASDVPVAAGLWSSSYDPSARRLSLTLPDEGFYKVKYDAIIDLEIKNEGGRNGYYVNGEKVDLSVIKDDITNTASLNGSGGYSGNDSDTWSAANVTGSATIESETGDLTVHKYDSLTNALLDGATFRLVPGRFEDGAFVPYNNTAVHRVFEETISYSTGNPADTLIERLECDILYQLTEVSAPADHKVFDGARYIVNRLPGREDKSDFGTVPRGITVERFVAGQTISIGNEPSDGTADVQTVVNISKRAVGGSDELPGAVIRIEKLSGSGSLSAVTLTGGMTDTAVSANAVTFTSGSAPAVITGLPAGSYRMIEDAAPAGYKKASSIDFSIRVFADGSYTVTRGGRPLADNTVIMEDECTSMTVSKQDVFGAELPGAALTITGRDAAGNAIDLSNVTRTSGNGSDFTASASSVSFISGTEPTVLSGLPEGSYVLHENAAPAGYIVAQDISFRIDANGRVRLPEGGAAAGNKLIMTDNRTYVILKKSDITESPQIPGASMEITSASGSDLSSVTVYNGRDVSASNGHLNFTTTSREAEIRGLPAGRYILTETYAPAGYKCVTSNFTFAVNENGTVVGAGSSDYSFDPVSHKIIVKDKIEEYTYEVTLGLSISKVDMARDGSPQLPGARLTIKPDSEINQTLDFIGVEVFNADNIDKGTNSVSFTTGSEQAKVTGLVSGSYVLIEEYAPNTDDYEITTNFYFRIYVDEGKITVAEGRQNGYNSLRRDGDGKPYIEIRNYLRNKPEDPVDPETEPTGTVTVTIPTETVNDTEITGTTGGFIDEIDSDTVTQPTQPTQTGTYPTGNVTGTYPTGPVFTSPGGTTIRGNAGFIDPSVTDHIDRNKEPEISEDVKAGMGISESFERENDSRGIIALAIITLLSAGAFAVFRKHRRDGEDVH